MDAADSQSGAFLSYFGYSADLARRSLELRIVRRTAERTLLVRLSPVDGFVGASAQGERIVLVVLKTDFVLRVLVACLESYDSVLDAIQHQR